MVQSYKKKLTYASKSQEKFSFFSFYKQISMSKIMLYIKRKKAKTILVLPLLYAVTHSALLYSALRDINKYVVAFVMRKSSVLTVGTSVFKKALQRYNFFLNCAIV